LNFCTQQQCLKKPPGKSPEKELRGWQCGSSGRSTCLSKCKTLRLNSSTVKKKKKKTERNQSRTESEDVLAYFP
jgi:hypothetical protein